MERAERNVSRILPTLIVLIYSLIVGLSQTADAATPPIWTISRYMSTANKTTLYNEGCALGRHDFNTNGTQYDVVVLHFGQPVRFSSGAYGATLYSGPDSTTSTIATAVEQYALGYYRCSDNDSQLEVSAGTSNHGSSVSRGHGQAWANMVDSINTWIMNNNISSQTRARGADDLELDWNSPSVTRSWVDGFVATAASTTYYYDFGTADGCRTDGQAAGDECGTANHPEWTAQDVWYISWGVTPALSFPEIYRNDGKNAYQWKGLSLYSYLHHASNIYISGSFTEHQACVDRGCNSSLDNTPNQGWNQLYNALNSDSRTSQGLPYSTDITWNNCSANC